MSYNNFFNVLKGEIRKKLYDTIDTRFFRT